MEVIITNALANWAQNANPVEFGKSVLLLYIAYRFFFKKTAEQITTELKKLTDTVEGLSKTIIKVESSHSARIGILENEVREIKNKQ